MNETPTIMKLPVALVIPGDNDRTVFELGDLTDLANSIKDHGLAQPITVRPIANGKYEIVAGERRFRAVSSVLKYETIDAIIRNLTDEEASAIMLIENVNRVDLNPMDEARSYKKRIDKFGWSRNEVAEKANVNGKRVAARLKLLDLAPEIQDLVKTYQLGLSYAECLAPLDNNRQRVAMRYLVETDRPSLIIFRTIVSRLLEQQLQDDMFSNVLFDICKQEFEDRKDEIASTRWPIDGSLPEFKKVKNIATSLETYLVQLMTSDDPLLQAAAPVVGRIYQGMIVHGMCYQPDNGPLSRLNK